MTTIPPLPTAEDALPPVVPTSMTGIMLHAFANLAPADKAATKPKTRLGPKLPGVPRDNTTRPSKSAPSATITMSGRSFISPGRRGSGPAHG